MKVISPSTVSEHGIGLPHITLGSEKFLTISVEMFDLLELSDTRGFVFIEDDGEFYIAGKELPDAFKVSKYPNKHNHVHNSSILAFWLREKFGYHKIIMIAIGEPLTGNPLTIEGITCWRLSVKQGVDRRGQSAVYKKMKDSRA